MLKIKHLLLLLFFSLCINKIYAQIEDSQELSFEEIEKNIDNVKSDPGKKWKLIQLYIKKSKKENNPETLLYAYRYASHFGNFSQNLKYADSAISVANKSQNKKLLTNAYINRGIVYMINSMYQQSLDDILVANKYSLELKDQYATYKTSYYIAQDKIYLGLYEEANKELETCIKYFRTNAEKNSSFGKDYQMYYLYSLMSYIDSNTRIGKQKENQDLLKEAFAYIEKNNLNQYLPYFISSEGTDAYYSGDYQTAINKLSEAIKLYHDDWAHITEVHYLGLSYWKIGKQYTAVKYLEEVDNEYNKTNKLDPQFRSAYEILIKYYDSTGNKDKQLEYINKLIILDKSYEKNYKYLYPKINKEYDTQKLLLEKNKIEKSHEFQKTLLSVLLMSSLATLVYFSHHYNKLQKTYRKKFNEIISEKSETNHVVGDQTISGEKMVNPKPQNKFDQNHYNKISGLNPLTVENILNQLEDFEKENKFTDPQISQRTLSESLNTNSNYLSKIINTYKEKNFNTYINDLRIDYIMNLMKNNARYLNLDVKELTRISGFTSAESFSDHFQRRFEIKPSYFIKMMKENVKTSAQSHNPTSI